MILRSEAARHDDPINCGKVDIRYRLEKEWAVDGHRESLAWQRNGGKGISIDIDVDALGHDGSTLFGLGIFAADASECPNPRPGPLAQVGMKSRSWP